MLDDFRDEFIRKNNNKFSYKGYEVLYNYYMAVYTEEYPYELDVIEICGEWDEYSSIEEFNEDYGVKYESLKELEQCSTLLRIDDSAFLISNF